MSSFCWKSDNIAANIAPNNSSHLIPFSFSGSFSLPLARPFASRSSAARPSERPSVRARNHAIRSCFLVLSERFAGLLLPFTDTKLEVIRSSRWLCHCVSAGGSFLVVSELAKSSLFSRRINLTTSLPEIFGPRPQCQLIVITATHTHASEHTLDGARVFFFRPPERLILRIFDLK